MSALSYLWLILLFSVCCRKRWSLWNYMWTFSFWWNSPRTVYRTFVEIHVSCQILLGAMTNSSLKQQNKLSLLKLYKYWNARSDRLLCQCLLSVIYDYVRPSMWPKIIIYQNLVWKQWLTAGQINWWST